MGRTCSGESLGGKGCGTCSLRKGRRAQALGELLGGATGWGQAWGAALGERELKYGEGNVGMQDEHARAVGEHAAAGAQGTLAAAEPLAPHIHGCWCHRSLG